MMVLVVDAGKGIQTQTAECIVIGEVHAWCSAPCACLVLPTLCVLGDPGLVHTPNCLLGSHAAPELLASGHAAQASSACAAKWGP